MVRQGMTEDELKDRLKKFALRIITLVDNMPQRLPSPLPSRLSDQEHPHLPTTGQLVLLNPTMILSIS